MKPTTRPKQFFLNDQRFDVPAEPIPLSALREHASPEIAAEHLIWRDVDGGRDTKLSEDKPVRIRAGDVFYSEGPDGAHPRTLKIVINDEVVSAPAVSMTGDQLRALPSSPIPAADKLFRDVDGSRDEAIGDREVVTLRFGAEFYSRSAFYIVVNGRKKFREDLDDRELTFDEVVALAFDDPPTGPQVTFSISYRNGPPQDPTGTLVAGQSVRARRGMIFNVTATDKS